MLIFRLLNIQFIGRGEDVSNQDITDLIDFLKLFADKRHHGKEESMLFPAFKEAGILKENRPIGVMLTEHYMCRNFIKQVLETVSNRKLDKKKFVKSAKDYISLLRSHINKENKILFPMGDDRLSEAKQEELINAFQKFEDTVIGKGKHEDLHKMLHDLNKRYLE